MKLIGNLGALAGWREKAEEYAPERGMVYDEIVGLIREAYSFQAFPQLTPGLLPDQVFMFQAGKFVSDGDTFGIGYLIMEANGDVVQCQTTDQAELVLNDLAGRMDDNLGFRLRSANKKISYVSNIVVEFDGEIERWIRHLGEMEDAINADRPDRPVFGLKSLRFGAPVFTAPGDHISTLEMQDFVIDRRVGTPFDENRYFCSAPLRTQEHLRLLETIEKIALSASG